MITKTVQTMTERETALATGGVEIEAPELPIDPFLNQDPLNQKQGKSTFYFLPDVQYDQLVLENMYKTIFESENPQ